MSIIRPTVFVLGAGASCHFPSFKTGLGLLWYIYNELKNPHELRCKLVECGYDEAHLVEFGSELGQSMQPSVDAFLERRNVFLDAGKAAIAASLIPMETPTHLQRPAPEQTHWYQYVIGKLTEGTDDVGKNAVAFLTFNYDRSLEAFFFSALRSSYGLKPEDAGEQVRSLKVIHLYGQLGQLPVSVGDEGLPYEETPLNQLDAATVTRAADEIRVYGQAGDDESFVEAQEILAQAELVVFLGFGFYGPNVERLGFDRLSDDLTLVASGQGVEEGEAAAWSELFPQKLRLLLGRDCLATLRMDPDVSKALHSG